MIATNLILAVVLLLVLSFSSQIFNDTIDENREHVDNLINRALAPLKKFAADVSLAWNTPAVVQNLLGKFLGPVLVVGLTGLVYSFNEPGLGLTEESAVLFLSLVIALGIATYVYEGGQAVFARRRFHLDAAVRMFPAALGIAVTFVVISRVTDFHAPIFYGFVASAALLGPGQVSERQDALAVSAAAVGLLAVSMVAWFLLIPLRDSAADSGTWGHLPSEVAALTFAGGIEGLVFMMLPIRFSDGRKIASVSRLLWLVLAVVPLFIFVWALVNPEAEQFDAVLEGRVVTVLLLVGAYAAAAMGVWLYFNFRARDSSPPGGPPRLQQDAFSSGQRAAFPPHAQAPDPIDPPPYLNLSRWRSDT